jgi:hypothetical protein
MFYIICNWHVVLVVLVILELLVSVAILAQVAWNGMDSCDG